MSNWMIVIAAVAAFVISSVTGKFLIPVLHKIKFGQYIKEIGPKWHKKKAGTPTMGGIMFISASVVVSVICYICLCIMNPDDKDFQDHIQFYAGMVMAVCFGAIGFIDDYIKVVKKNNDGLTEKQKLVLQTLVAVAYVFTLMLGGCRSATIVPFVGTVDLGVFYWIFSVILIVGFVNATNLTDGIDGLDGSVNVSSQCGTCRSLSWISALELLSCKGVYGRYRLAVSGRLSVCGCIRNKYACTYNTCRNCIYN